METPPDATCPTGVGTCLVDAAIILCQPDLDWQEAAAITEVCARELWPHDLDTVSLFPEVRHILECQLAVEEFLDHVRNGCGDPEDKLRLACQLLIRSAAALHKIRGCAKDALSMQLQSEN